MSTSRNSESLTLYLPSYPPLPILVVTENSIRSENTEVPIVREIMVATTMSSHLWRSKLDESERLQLTYPPMYAVLPRWSPDGKKIIFFEFEWYAGT